MENQEYIDNALCELEKVNIEELPEEMRESTIYIHVALVNLSTMLEEMEQG